MTLKIDKKIVGYEVVDISQPQKKSATGKKDLVEEKKEEGATIVQMHEKLQRPEMLLGSTYKIKTPMSDHALYVTINDVVLNPDTEHELRRPFEIFINSKNMEHYQWIAALTLIISAVFRKGGDVTFLVDELRGVFNPQGGYFKSGGRYMPSIVAEIGDAIESHMKMIGLLEHDLLDEHQRKHIEEKRAQYELKSKRNETASGESFPHGSTLCQKCLTKAKIQMDGCLTCLNCGDSKCG